MTPTRMLARFAIPSLPIGRGGGLPAEARAILDQAGISLPSL